MASSQGIYDIDFQSADQAINDLVTTGAAPDHVSSVVFGAPLVVSAFGPLTDQPLLFNTDGESPIGSGFYYTQIELTIPAVPLSDVDLSFDMVDSGSDHSFTVFFDTPSVRKFEFNTGQISFINPRLPDAAVGTYQMDQANHMDIHVDYQLNQWSFSENNSVLGNGAFDPDGSLRSIRFNFAAFGPNISGTAIDNLVVAVPEPSLLAILGSAGCVLVGGHLYRRKRRQPPSSKSRVNGQFQFDLFHYVRQQWQKRRKSNWRRGGDSNSK